MENVVSLSFENVVTVTIMCIIAWLVITFLAGYLENSRG